LATPGMRTILVIDDSHLVLAFARSTLETAGFRVITRSRSEGCVALILQEKPDAVLVDPSSAAADTVVRLFGKAQLHSEVLVLFHSGTSEEALKAQVLATGAHGHVRKSEDSFELIQQIQRWLRIGSSSHSKLKAGNVAEVPGGYDSSGSSVSLSGRKLSGEAGSNVAPARRSSGSLQLDLPVVLFIDDDMGTLSGFRREVQSEPYLVEFALSGTRAIQRITTQPIPRVVVSDLMMPEPSGVEVYERVVREDPSWRERFIFVTGAAALQDFRSFIAEFGGTVLRKPVDGAVLRKAIRRALAVAEEHQLRQTP